MSLLKKEKTDLRLAIISDPHLGFTKHINPNYYGLGQQGDQDKWWEHALLWFKKRGIDALVVPGDMANACAYGAPGITSADCAKDEMKRLVKIFKKVFANTDAQLICIYGNHDNYAQKLEKLNGGEETPWEDAFGEPYSRVVRKYVKGYSFVGAHWGFEAEAKDIIKEEAEKNPNKPVFYIQHGEIKGTTCDTLNENLSSVGINNIKDYENVIAFFGHTHCPITDERTIWQSEEEGAPKCTVISSGTFNYGDSTGDLLRGENLQTKHALYLTVSDMKINVERLSFYTDEMLALAKGEKTKQNMKKCVRSAGADWKFTLGGEKLLDTKRRAANAKAPEFPENAEAGLARSDNFAVVFFPAALPLECDDDILHSYYVEAWEDESGELVSCGQINSEFHVDHSTNYFSPYYQVVIPDLKPDTAYTFKVYARDCFQKLSERPIIHKGKTLPKKRERLY